MMSISDDLRARLVDAATEVLLSNAQMTVRYPAVAARAVAKEVVSALLEVEVRSVKVGILLAVADFEAREGEG